MEPDLAQVLEKIRRANLWEFMGVEVNGPNVRGSSFNQTPLHVVAVWGDVDAARILLDAGAEIDVSGEGDFTALHEAILQEHVEMVRLLVARGADLQRRCEFGSTLELAESAENPELLKIVQAALPV